MIKKIKWITFSIFLILSIVITILVLTNQFKVIDDWFYDLLIRFESPSLTSYFRYITLFADRYLMMIMFLLISLWTIFKKSKIGIYYIGTLIITVVTNQVLKFIFARPRPSDIDLIVTSGYSFPSGHAMMSVALYGFMIYLIMNSRVNKLMKYILSLILLFLIISICLSRVYLGVHYFSDIFVGVIISICILIITIDMMKRKGVI